MRKKKKFYREPDNTVIVASYVTEIVEANRECNNRIKNTFKCKSASGNDKMCILWGRVNLTVGDKVQLKGWYAPNGVFIVKEILIIPDLTNEKGDIA